MLLQQERPPPGGATCSQPRPQLQELLSISSVFAPARRVSPCTKRGVAAGWQDLQPRFKFNFSNPQSLPAPLRQANSEQLAAAGFKPDSGNQAWGPAACSIIILGNWDVWNSQTLPMQRVILRWQQGSSLARPQGQCGALCRVTPL